MYTHKCPDPATQGWLVSGVPCWKGSGSTKASLAQRSPQDSGQILRPDCVGGDDPTNFFLVLRDIPKA